MLRRNLKWILAAPLVVVALLFGGAWFYTHVVEGDPPERLTLSPATPAPSGTTSGVGTADGTWTVTSDSQVGYRVDEVLFGQAATAVGRTNQVTGSLTVAGTSVIATSFTVDMASVTSDQARRDGQYRGRIMDTSTYPTATFALTQPIDLGTVPADGETISATATGKLTLRGQAKDVTFDVKARRTGATIEVNGSIHLVFADWGIPSPSFGPANVDDNGDLEFLLVFAK